MISRQFPPESVSERTIAALDAMRETWRHGRKVLFVFGAGASVAARIPSMRAVYRDLEQRTSKAARDWKLPGKAETNSNGSRNSEEAPTPEERGLEILDRLAKDLALLAEERGARSKAAKTLGTLQKAHGSTNPVFVEIGKIWADFSEDFVMGRVEMPSGGSTASADYSTEDRDLIRRHIQDTFTEGDLPFLTGNRRFQMPQGTPSEGQVPLPKRQPTGLHRLVAEMVSHDKALVVSLNFDGLTFRALEQRRDKARPVALSTPAAIRDFFVGGTNESVEHLVPVVKVWGDVFHAVCRNPRCPQRDHQTPIFKLETDRESWTHCPTCQDRRQLEIYFTGFEKKEEQTHETMCELLRFMGPEVGCIATVGVSGLWDEALVRFIAQVSSGLQREQKLLAEPSAGKPALPAVVCVDPLPSALLRHLAAAGVAATHLPVGGEAWAGLFDSNELKLAARQTCKLAPFDGTPIKDGLWSDKFAEGGRLPGTYGFLASPDQAATGSFQYLPRFRWLRQLGIKTVVAGVKRGGDAFGLKEAEHNRFNHSIGAAHLAASWSQMLCAQRRDRSPMDGDTLATVVLYAAMHHDVGHIPFTHLAEEVFEEVHWTMHPWSDAFHHDEPVLFNVIPEFEKSIGYALNRAARMLEVDPRRLRFWTESAIQGRLGIPWVDGILNSPLDVDKIDYVFRDCTFLGQGLHFVSDGQGDPGAQTRKRQEEVEGFMEATLLLPSGLIALSGPAGVFARHLLEERRWLYKHQYYRPPMRALERIAAAIILRWMLDRVGRGQADKFFGKSKTAAATDSGAEPLVVSDTSALKGEAARDLLWDNLARLREPPGGKPSGVRDPGEPDLLIRMIEDLRQDARQPGRGDGPLAGWAERAEQLFNWAFNYPPAPERLHEELQKRISYSESCYIGHEHLPVVRRIVREIETLRPLRVFFDIAVMPRLLSYPSARRLKWNQKSVLQECFVVPHRDPDRWQSATDRWVPLSESAFARYDERRWARIMTVSVFPDDPEIWHSLDVFRATARAQGVEFYENDPDGYS